MDHSRAFAALGDTCLMELLENIAKTRDTEIMLKVGVVGKWTFLFGNPLMLLYLLLLWKRKLAVAGEK